MKRLIIALLLAASAGAAYALSCTTSTIMIDGRILTCTTCCTSGGHCTTNCF